MADFVAVLKKTIDGLSDNTPQMREKVFEKAHSTVEAKLAAINPPPPQAVADRQRKALEDAIAVVRSDYDGPADPDGEDEEFESLMASLAASSPPDPQDAPPVEPESTEMAQASRQETGEPDAAIDDAPAQGSSDEQDRTPEPVVSEPLVAASHDEPAQAADARETDTASAAREVELREEASWVDDGPSLNDGDDFDADPDKDAGAAEPEGAADEEIEPVSALSSGMAGAAAAANPKQKRRWKGPLATIFALLLIGGGAYGIWLNQDDLSRMVGLSSVIEVTEEDDDAMSEDEEAVTEGDQSATEDDDPGAQQAAVEASDLAALSDEDSDAPQAGDETAEKFTQRLMPDGSEIDDGPAEEAPSIGEGSSISSVTPDENGEADGEVQIAQNDDVDDSAVTQDDVSVPVGQRAIFYEERTNTAQGSAQTGSTVWRRVEESPGSDLPPEPAIRAEATIPDMNLQLRMTIRRNGDETLPASHIIEMIFLTPDDFEGGGIDNISRITFKDNEQSAGNPLLGIPAKIADGFFLLALNEAASDVETNLTLMQRQSWVDIPLVYRSGRRALVTLEKGLPGDRIFQEVIAAWTEEESG